MKHIRNALAALLIAACLMAPAMAAEPVDADPVPSGSETVTPRAEEFEWYFRQDENGRWQRRLWSVTYGYWVTDWEYFD